jgi:hypothetical protein
LMEAAEAALAARANAAAKTPMRSRCIIVFLPEAVFSTLLQLSRRP